MLRAGSRGWGPWFLALFLVAGASAGQPARTSERTPEVTPPSGAPGDVTRPIPKSSFAVPYPAGESRRENVVLELVVDRSGSVSEARVIQGEEPFARAALDAARSFAFEPARRGDQPVPARIRLEVRFVPPEPPRAEEEAEAPPGSRTRARRAPAPSDEPMEIVVLGERAAPARASLGRAEVRELPGAFGDPFRAVEVLPGVTPIFTGVPFFYVRGSPPGNVGYFLDGIRVPLLFHVALGPSVIHPGLVERVDIYPGGYPARYGRFAGAMVTAETAAPRREFRGEANVRIFDAGALLEAPFASGRGSALVAGRYSYTAAALSLFAPEVTLSYWDYQGRVSYELGSDWTVGAFGFGAFDLFRADDEDSSVGTQFHRLDLRLDHTPGPATRIRIAATAGVDLSGAQEGNNEGDSTPELQDRILGARVELEHQLDTKTRFRAGADVNVDNYRIVDIETEEETGQAEFFYTRDDITAGVRADLVWEPSPGIVVTPGLRADLYMSDARGSLALEPRLAAEFTLSPVVTLEHTFGVAHQAPSFVVPVPGFQLSDLEDGLQRTFQSSAGVIVRPGGGFQLGLTLFHNVFTNFTDYLGTISLRERTLANGEDDRLDIRSLGQAYGLEILVKRPLTRRLGGFLAYTLSRTTRTLGRARSVANFDRTHVLHAALSYDLGRNWRAGARFTTYSGAPAQQDFTELEEADPLSLIAVPANRRGPPFYRVDARLEKRWLIDREGRFWSFVIEMLNATLNKETPFYTCRPNGCEGEAVGPVAIPSVGAEVFF